MAEKKVFDIAPGTSAPTVVTHATSTMAKKDSTEIPQDNVVPVEVRREKVIAPSAEIAVETKDTTMTNPEISKDNSPQESEDLTDPIPRDVQSVPKALDTTQYQLPIQRHSKATSGKMMLQFIFVFLLLAIIGVVIAIDAEMLDVGVELPFDFL